MVYAGVTASHARLVEWIALERVMAWLRGTLVACVKEITLRALVAWMTQHAIFKAQHP